MNKWLKLSLTLSCILVMNSTFAVPHSQQQSLDRIVANVNKTVITQSELDEAIEKIKKQLSASHTPIPPAAILRKQVLDQLINRKLQLDLAEQMGIHVTDADVTKAINSVAQKNRITTDKLYAAVNEQGLSKEEYRQEIHDEMTTNRIAQQVLGGKIVISEQEVDNFMKSPAFQSYNTKEYHLEDILIALPDKPSMKDITEAKIQAEAILAKLHRGVSFTEAATDSTGKPLQGGDLGWRKLPEIPSAFADKIITMKINDIAGPIQTANGYHIIHVAGIRSAGMQGSKEDLRKQAQELLYQRKYEEALKAWNAKLRSEAYISIHLDK